MRMEMVQKGQMACASPCAIQQSRRSLEQRSENQGSERGGRKGEGEGWRYHGGVDVRGLRPSSLGWTCRRLAMRAVSRAKVARLEGQANTRVEARGICALPRPRALTRACTRGIWTYTRHMLDTPLLTHTYSRHNLDSHFRRGCLP